MKLISTGWQYKIYDLGNNRVRKIKFSGLAQYGKIFFHTPGFPFSIIETYRKQKSIRKTEESSNTYIRSVLSHIDDNLLGNPTFLNDSDYEQDKVVTIQNYLKNADTREGKRIIDEYVDNIHTFWSYGFSDCAFKIGNNNGVNSRGGVIQIDFGELVTEKARIEKLITNQVWIKDYIGKRLPAGEIRQYHTETLSRRLTSAKLNEVWRSRL